MLNIIIQFLSTILLVTERRVQNFPTLIVDLSILPSSLPALALSDFVSCSLNFCYLGDYIFTITVLLLNQVLYHYKISLFKSDKIPCFEIYSV